MWLESQVILQGFHILLYISVDGVELTVTKKQKYLGLIFDCNLCWAHYVSSVCS